MIEARDLTKRYGAFRALDKVSFEVKRGEVVGFLGPNGAGKSTTMRILTCYLSASAGTAKVHGHDVFDEPLAVRESIGYLPQRAQMYGEMGVLEYLRFVAELRKIDSNAFKKRMGEIVEVCGLGNVLGKDIHTLSHGFRQRVGLGQALLHNPPILILDEPTSDLDPNEKAEVVDYIKEIGKDRTVVLSTHNLSEVEAACARAIIISRGRVVADGGIDDVRARGGRVRYVVSIDEKRVLESGGTYRENSSMAPKAGQVEDALGGIDGVLSVVETPSDDTAHSFVLKGTRSTDLRAEIYSLCVQKGWLLLSMNREVQRLEDVFKTLTRGDDAGARGRTLADDVDEDEDFDDEEEDAREDVEDEGDDAEDDDDEDASEDDEDGGASHDDDDDDGPSEDDGKKK
ncbi:MAG: ATP-binding cassette domain-containing protein [Myxococcota bacterium]